MCAIPLRGTMPNDSSAIPDHQVLTGSMHSPVSFIPLLTTRLTAKPSIKAEIVGLQQRFELADGRCGIKPAIIVLRHQHHWHAVMHTSDERICFSHDDGRG